MAGDWDNIRDSCWRSHVDDACLDLAAWVNLPMTPWHVIRCNHTHAGRVADVIRADGWDVWSPQQLVITRHPAARRHTHPSNAAKEKWYPLLPGCLFSPIRTLPDALVEGGRYPCSLMMVAPYTPAEIAFDSLCGFMVEIDRANQETLRRATPRGPAVRKKQEWRDWKAGLAELVATAGVKMEQAA